MYPTTLASIAVLISKALQHYGIDYIALFKEAGLDPAMMRDAHARYSFAKITRLWQLAGKVTKDPCFGLVAAGFWHPTTLHALGYSWLASTNLKEAMERLVRYARIVNTHVVFQFEELDDSYRLIMGSQKSFGEELKPAFEAMDGGFALILGMCKTSYGKDFLPSKLEMRRPEPENLSRFKQHFKVPMKFNCEQNIIYFQKSTLEKNLVTANPDLTRVNDKVITDYLASLDTDNIDMLVKAKMLDSLASGRVSEIFIAQSINMSTRSLQRKLKEHETSFKRLLDETRKELAGQYIENQGIAINEITYLLGFSEPSNFSRAFKRWNGLSPSAYRESL